MYLFTAFGPGQAATVYAFDAGGFTGAATPVPRPLNTGDPVMGSVSHDRDRYVASGATQGGTITAGPIEPVGRGLLPGAWTPVQVMGPGINQVYAALAPDGQRVLLLGGYELQVWRFLPDMSNFAAHEGTLSQTSFGRPAYQRNGGRMPIWHPDSRTLFELSVLDSNPNMTDPQWVVTAYRYDPTAGNAGNQVGYFTGAQHWETPTPTVTDWPASLAVHPSGTAVVLAYGKTTGTLVTRAEARHYDPATGFGALYGTTPANTPQSNASGLGARCFFSPRGDLFGMISDAAPYLHLWRWDDVTGFGAKLPDLPLGVPVGEHLSAVAFSPNGRQLAVATQPAGTLLQPATIRVFDFDPVTGTAVGRAATQATLTYVNSMVFL
jgi:hypothetical protein